MTWILNETLFLRSLFTVKQLLLPFWVRKRVPTKISNNEVYLTKLINIWI